MLLKHERQTYKVFFKALEEANLAISQSSMSKWREGPTKVWLADGSRNGDDLSHWFKLKFEVLEERA